MHAFRDAQLFMVDVPRDVYKTLYSPFKRYPNSSARWATPIVASRALRGAISRGFNASETARESITVIRHESPDDRRPQNVIRSKFKMLEFRHSGAAAELGS
jgi:hypothetical protein